ncbi:hypothetical protein D3C87_1885460 [compost metagenome]
MNTTVCRGEMRCSVPVRGLRPSRSARDRTCSEPKAVSLTFSPAISASPISANMASPIAAVSALLKPVRRAAASLSMARVIVVVNLLLPP